MRTQREVSWVVYETPVGRTADRVRAVCGASEWPAIQAEQPEGRTLVRADVGSEGEAERLARGTAGDTPPRVAKPRPVVKSTAPAASGVEVHAVRHSSGRFAPLPVPECGTVLSPVRAA